MSSDQQEFLTFNRQKNVWFSWAVIWMQLELKRYNKLRRLQTSWPKWTKGGRHVLGRHKFYEYCDAHFELACLKSATANRVGVSYEGKQLTFRVSSTESSNGSHPVTV